MADLARRSGVSYPTIHAIVRHGATLKLHHKARALSDATSGEVTVEELCEPPRRRRRSARSG